ncbi:MAG TPA: hypothetical protein VN540_02555 [Clostridia bacterium]|nr:hypothetical protein [Clostridia bacterium]
MLQERSGGAKDDPGMDLFFVILIVLLIVFAKNIVGLFRLLPAPWDTVVLVAAALFIAIFFYLFFTKRIVDYRYSLASGGDGEGEDGAPEGDKPLIGTKEGTVLFERMIANKGRLVEKVEPEELVALVEPGKSYAERIGAGDVKRCSGLSAAKSHLLVYLRESRLMAVRFSPGTAMARRIREVIEAHETR